MPRGMVTACLPNASCAESVEKEEAEARPERVAGLIPFTSVRAQPDSRIHRPGGNLGANLKSISHRRHPILVACVWEFTKKRSICPWIASRVV